MPRLVWFVLNDGRSMVAGCDSTTQDTLERVLAAPEKTLTFTKDDRIEVLPSSHVRDYVFFDARQSVPPAAAIYRFVGV